MSNRLRRLALPLIVVAIPLLAPSSAFAVGETGSFNFPQNNFRVGGSMVNIDASADGPFVQAGENPEIWLDNVGPVSGCDQANINVFGGPTAPAGPINLGCIWDASGVAEGAHLLTIYVTDDTLQLVPASGSINVIVDNTAPTGGTLTVPAQDGPSTSVELAYTRSSDPNPGQLLVERREAVLAGGTCGAFGAFSPITGDISNPPASTYADATLLLDMCYQYRLGDYDEAFNVNYLTSPNTVKVRAVAPPTPPALALALSSTSSAVKVSGSTITYNPNVAGSFTVTGTPSSGSGTYASVAFPDVDGSGTGFTPSGIVDTSGPFQVTYSWTAGASASGAQTVTVTDANTLTATASFTIVADSTAPSGGTIGASVDKPEGGSARVVVKLTPGTDASGIGTTTLQRMTGERVDGDCVKFGAFSDIATNPSATYTDTSVAEDRCYLYRLVVRDVVGNSMNVDLESLVIVNTKRAVVEQTSGNDRYNGTDDAEYVALGAGNDVVRLGGGDDGANGGTGNDTIRGNLGNDCYLFGGGGDDLIYGGPGADCIYGNTGNDKLHGGSGADYVNGDRGADFITGGSGNDEIDAGSDDDKVGGGDDDDKIYGGNGNDLLLGHDGDDVIRADRGDDTINGGAGDDRLWGVHGNDQIVGGDGDDRVDGLYGYDALYGGDGNDSLSDIVAIDPGAIPERYGMYGGLGRDRLDLLWTPDFDDTEIGLKMFEKQLPFKPYVINCGGGADTVKIQLEASPRNSYAYALGYRSDAGIVLEQCGEATLEFNDTTWLTKQCFNFVYGVQRRLKNVGIAGSAGSYKLGPQCQKAADEFRSTTS